MSKSGEVSLMTPSPLGPPNWRWLAAADCPRGAALTVVANDDPFVQRAVRFRQGGRSDSIGDAVRWFVQNQPLRWAVESRILSRLPIEAIAELHGLRTASVTAFAYLFFDVADRLGYTDFIMLHAIGTKIYNLSLNDQDVYLRFLGYFAPPLLGDVLEGVDLSDPKAVTVLRDRLFAMTSFGVRVLPNDTPEATLRVLRLLDLRSQLDRLRAVVAVRLGVEVPVPDPRLVVITSSRSARAG